MERVELYRAAVKKADEDETDAPELGEEPWQDLTVPDEDEEDPEKESDRVKEKFKEQKSAEQEHLKAFIDALKVARQPLERVMADRGEEPTHKGVRWHCR